MAPESAAPGTEAAQLVEAQEQVAEPVAQHADAPDSQPESPAENQIGQSPHDQPPPHLEVVAPPESQQADESSADISDKVDRLLEELREVT
jgi:hypothetical protein